MSIRLRFFLSVAFILLVGSLSSYFIPKYLVDKDIDKAGEKIRALVETRQKDVSQDSLLPILNDLRSSILDKISLNLLWAALLGLGIALFLLAKLSKKMTKPIVQMAKAAEEIGAGNYEGIILPNVFDRQDEVAILVKNFDKMRLGLQEREKIRGILNKVVSKEIASEILKNPIELGGEERIVTILFADVRGFTQMIENMPPQHVISMMNHYLTDMCDIIDTHQGVVDKFVGDEIMALYGAPINLQNHAVHAIKTAIEMQKTMVQKNALPKEPMMIGIGIHTGLVVAGNQGTKNRLNYTVLGAHVNLAARLCSSALPGQILITEAILQEPNVREQFKYESLGPRQFKGFDRPIEIFNIVYSSNSSYHF